MLTDSFDPHGTPVVTPELCYGPQGKQCDVCVLTFSHAVVTAAAERFSCTVAAQVGSVAGDTPIHVMDTRGVKLGFTSPWWARRAPGLSWRRRGA